MPGRTTKVRSGSAVRTRTEHPALPPGTILSATFRGQTYAARVVEGQSEGKVAVETEGGRWPSLSAAGKAITGYAVNGWRFWKVVESDGSANG